MQSCLEKRGKDERDKEIIKSDYNNLNKENNYSSSHPDALSNGDAQGKGSSHGGHKYWKPHYYNGNTNFKNTINYDNFDTSIESNIGGCYDINGRNNIGGRVNSIQTNIFNSNYQYSADIIGTKIKK